MAVDIRAHIQLFDQAVDPPFCVRILQAVERREIVQYLAAGQTLVETGGTAEIAYLCTDLFRVAHDVISTDLGCAGRWRENGRQYAQQRGLAGAVRTQQAKDLSGACLQGNPIDRRNSPALLILKCLLDVVDCNHLCFSVLGHERPTPSQSVRAEPSRSLQGKGGLLRFRLFCGQFRFRLQMPIEGRQGHVGQKLMNLSGGNASPLERHNYSNADRMQDSIGSGIRGQSAHL